MILQEHFSVVIQSVIKTSALLAAALFSLYRAPVNLGFLYAPLAAAAVLYAVFYAVYHLSTDYIADGKNFGMTKKFIVRGKTLIGFKEFSRVSVTQNPADKLFRTKQIGICDKSGKEINISFSNHDWQRIEKFFTGEEEVLRTVKINDRALLLYALVNPLKMVKLINYLLTFVTAALLIFLSGTGALLLILAYVAAAVISVIINTAMIIIKYHGYTMKFTPQKLFIEYGKITKKTFIIPFDAVDGVIIKRNPMNVLLKNCAPFLLLAGNPKKSKPFLLSPVIDNKDALRLIKNSYIDISDSDIKAKASKNMDYLYLFPVFLPLLFVMLILLPMLFVANAFLGVAAILVLALTVFDRRQAYKSAYYAENETVASALRGGFISYNLFYKKSALQGKAFNATVFSERKRYYKLTLYLRRHKPFSTGYIKDN